MIEFLKYTHCIDYWLLENKHDTPLFNYSNYLKDNLKSKHSEIITLTDWVEEHEPQLYIEFKNYIKEHNLV